MPGPFCLPVKEFYGARYKSGLLFLDFMWGVVFTACVVFLSLFLLEVFCPAYFNKNALPPAAQIKTDLPPAAQILCWLLPSLQKHKNKKLLQGGGFFGVAGGN